MPKVGRNQFNLVQCFQWYIQHLIARGSASDDETIAEERKQLVRAQRLRIELEMTTRRGELIEAETMAIVVNDMASIFANHMESLSARLSNTLAGENNPVAVAEMLTLETRAIRNAVSAAIVDYAVTDDGSPDSRGPPRKKRGRVGRRKQNAASRGARAGAVANQ